MGNVVHWIDLGQDGYRVCLDIPLRKNGMPPLAAAKAASALLENFNPAAFDPIEPVPESVARAAVRDGAVRISDDLDELLEPPPGWPDPHKHASLDGALGCAECNSWERNPLNSKNKLPTIGMPHVEMTGDDPPVPVFDEDEFPGPRCANGACYGD